MSTEPGRPGPAAETDNTRGQPPPSNADLQARLQRSSSDDGREPNATLQNHDRETSGSSYMAPTHRWQETERSPLLRGDPSATPGYMHEGDDDDDDSLEPEGNMFQSTFEDPALHRTSNVASLMHLLKGNIGTGILAMPAAIKNAGLWVGFGGVLFIGLIATHCMHLLVKCSHQLGQKTGHGSLDYGTVGEQAVAFGPEPLRRFSKFAKILINVFLCITQFGFCTVYILFVAQNVRQVMTQAAGQDAPWTSSDKLYCFFVFLLLVPYVFVRKLKHLAPFSTLANVLTVAGLVVILQYCFWHLKDIHDKEIPAFNSWRKLPVFFGIAAFAIEGISLILPIENKMETPEAFVGPTGLLNLGMVLVVVMYAAVGFYGFLSFGQDTCGSITLSLPSDQWLYLCVRLCYSLAIYVTYGLQFYVPMSIIWPGIKERLRPGSWMRRHGEKLLRIVFLVLTFLLAMSVPHLDLMISLIGALASSNLAFIFPPLLEIFTCWPDGLGRYRWRLVKDILISLFGLVGFFAGTSVTIIEIVEAFKGQEDPC